MKLVTHYTISDRDDNTSLSHSNLANTAITSIDPATPSLTGTNMLANTWGYTLSTPAAEGADEVNNTTNLGLTYKPIPTDYTVIKSSDSLTEGETSKLTFGVKISNGIPSGVYSDEILISAIINYSSAGYDQSKLWLNKNGTRITTLQEMTPDVCASVPTPTVTATGSNVPEITLRDTRDNNTYKVRKLADGNCWMVESLKLANRTGSNKLTPADSNVTTDFELPAAVASSATANSTTRAYVVNDGMNGTYLYNFYAVTAGSGGSIKSGNAPQDICPKGWHLPNHSGNGSWNKLLRVGEGAYEITTSTKKYSTAKVNWGVYDDGNGHGIKIASGNPLGLQNTGNLSGQLIYNKENGFYWTRAASSTTRAYFMVGTSTELSPQSSDEKHYGFAARCVADDKEYMQNWDGCSSLSVNESITLKDARDNKEYTVAKIDSQCWMTKNLNLAGGTTLTPADSHVTSDYTLPASSTSGFSDNDTGINTAYVYNTPLPDSNGYGGYYSWRAATAGTGTISISVDGDIAPADICPKGWRLPTESEFDDSITGYSRRGIFKPVLAGYYYDSLLDSIDFEGFYWSSTAQYDYDAYILRVDDRDMYMGNYYRNNGLSVRCVFGS